MTEVQATYVRFPVDLHAQVKDFAAANALSMAQVIRSAVREKLDPALIHQRMDGASTPLPVSSTTRGDEAPVATGTDATTARLAVPPVSRREVKPRFKT